MRSKSQTSSLPEGLFAKVMACGDELVMLAPKLITNQTSITLQNTPCPFEVTLMEGNNTIQSKEDHSKPDVMLQS